MLNKSRFKWLLVFINLSFLISILSSEEINPNYNCFTILVGKEASQTGNVLFAHNEDDWGKQVVYIHKVPRVKHQPDESYSLKNGGKLPQVAVTNAYLWIQIPKANFGDAFLNEYGVIIASNACPSRCTEADLTEGGIDYDLRKIVAERAKTAREGVKIAGQLIEKFGYNSSGRTYSIADPNEAYFLAVVYGRLWVAQRIPDNAVALIPNYYTIARVDLQDTLNFLSSPDITKFAIKQGWIDSTQSLIFNFRTTYSNPAELYNERNYARHWRALNYFENFPYDINTPLPTYITPKKKVRKEDLFHVLCLHYEGTHLDKPGNPHTHPIMTICSEANQYAVVAELKSHPSPAIGSVLWLAPRRPCVMPFFPIRAAVEKLPENLAPFTWEKASIEHFNPSFDFYSFNPNLFYWRCWEFTAKIDSTWEINYPKIQKRRDAYQQKFLKREKKFYNRIQKVYSTQPEKVLQLFDDYTVKTFKLFYNYLSL